MEIRIEGRMGPVCVVSPCALHGDPFELVKGVAILVGYGDGGGVRVEGLFALRARRRGQPGRVDTSEEWAPEAGGATSYERGLR
jgi:hypothetical protein